MTDVPPAPTHTVGHGPGAADDELVSRFNRDGFLIVKGAVGTDVVDRVRRAADRIVEEGAEPGRWWGKPETAPRRVEYRGLFNLDEAFMDLLAPAAVFPLIVRILGANLHMMSSQLIYQKPHQPATEAVRGGWHRDVIGTSEDLGYDATPRMALRVGYYLSDITEPGTGATLFAPGSHLLTEPIAVSGEAHNPSEVVRPVVEPGDAVIWENRTFHCPERNTSDRVRKAVMIQYGYRWLRPVDFLTHRPELLARCDPAARQLLDSTDLNADGSMTRMKGSRAMIEWAAAHGL